MRAFKEWGTAQKLINSKQLEKKYKKINSNVLDGAALKDHLLASVSFAFSIYLGLFSNLFFQFLLQVKDSQLLLDGGKPCTCLLPLHYFLIIQCLQDASQWNCSVLL